MVTSHLQEQPKPTPPKVNMMRFLSYFMFGVTLTDSGQKWMSNMTDEDTKEMREFFGVKNISEINARSMTWYSNMKGCD